MIKDTFDKYTGDILSDEEMESYIARRNVLCAYYNNQLCGTLQFEIRNNIIWLGHIAISELYRGKGIAKELVKAFISYNAIDANTRYHLWVLKDNNKAIALYRDFGFIYNNKSSASMLKLSNNA